MRGGSAGAGSGGGSAGFGPVGPSKGTGEWNFGLRNTSHISAPTSGVAGHDFDLFAGELVLDGQALEQSGQVVRVPAVVGRGVEEERVGGRFEGGPNAGPEPFALGVGQDLHPEVAGGEQVSLGAGPV